MIGDIIKRKRIEHNMTQAELAEKLEVGSTTVSSWEISRTEPNLGQCSKLSKLFDISLEELIDGTKNKRAYSVNIPGVNIEIEKNEPGSNGLNLYARFLRYCELSEEKRKMVDAYIDFIKSQ